MLRSHIHTDSVRICYSDEWSLKQSSHVKVMLANSFGKLKLVCVNGATTCWQTVGKKLVRIETNSIYRQQFANMLLCRSHTPI